MAFASWFGLGVLHLEGSMARFLIVYGTTDGHTAKIAANLAADLSDHGAMVTVLDASAIRRELPLEPFDGVIVAASIHIGNYQRAVRRWVRAHVEELNALPTAFLSVCLGVLEQQPKAQAEVRATAEKFLRQAGWEPWVTKTIAGALPYTRYHWVKKLIMRRIAARAGNDTDTTRDYEYTDWDDLREFATVFTDQAERRERAGLALLR
jgi:menaquinone-dependent protoporphyrinogen oxidase